MGPLVPILASGAPGGFVSSAASSGMQWLAQRFASHKQAVQEEAQRNAQAFLDELASRVKVLEDALGADPSIKPSRTPAPVCSCKKPFWRRSSQPSSRSISCLANSSRGDSCLDPKNA